MPAGLPFGTTIMRTLVANVSTSPVTPASSASCIEASSAVARTSPGAPSATCSARLVLESKEKHDVDVVLRLERLGEVVEGVGQRGGGEHGELAATSAAVRCRARAVADPRTRRGGAAGRRTGEPPHLRHLHDDVGGLDRRRWHARPGSRPSSSAASALISDTTR